MILLPIYNLHVYCLFFSFAIYKGEMLKSLGFEIILVHVCHILDLF